MRQIVSSASQPPPPSMMHHQQHGYHYGGGGVNELTRTRSNQSSSHAAGRSTTNRSSSNKSQTTSKSQTSTSKSKSTTHPSSSQQQQRRQQESQQQQQIEHSRSQDHSRSGHNNKNSISNRGNDNNHNRPVDGGGGNNNNNDDGGAGGGGIISPDLLVDALSGQEDGLLAIAERLMEHYDRGYDVMGEAIIDAFADVQKLFQHAVEAAHMEGAAMEANRAREEAAAAAAATAATSTNAGSKTDPSSQQHTGKNGDSNQKAPSPALPEGMEILEEFVDDDVKDVLREAIERVDKLQQSIRSKGGTGNPTKQESMEWYDIYERACTSASALLPVDSDHRGRLQLAIARGESVPPDRACALLRYAMEGVMRNTGDPLGRSTPTIDPSKRSDCVLQAPGVSTADGSGGMGGDGSPHNNVAVLQSSEEHLDSMVAEMKDVLSAPMYEHTPIHMVATRFFEALESTRKCHARREEILSQKLGELKGDFLLQKAEWEEKLSDSQMELERWKQAYLELKENSFRIGGAPSTMGGIPSSPSRGALSEIGTGGGGSGGASTTRSFFTKNRNDDLNRFLNRMSPSTDNGTVSSGRTHKQRAESVISQASMMGHQAKKLLACGSEPQQH